MYTLADPGRDVNKDTFQDPICQCQEQVTIKDLSYQGLISAILYGVIKMAKKI